MKVVLYSDNTNILNKQVDSYIPNIVHKRSISITMIIASPDVENMMISIFSDFLEDEFFMIDKRILKSWDLAKNFESVIETSDIVYLSGGNTVDFLKNINNSNLRKSILRHVSNQKLLIGASAGSILITSGMRLDLNISAIDKKKLNPLGLVKFEIEPHYDESKDRQLLEYSKIASAPLYALKDGSAIIIDGYKEKMLGSIYLFTNGNKALVTCNC